MTALFYRRNNNGNFECNSQRRDPLELRSAQLDQCVNIRFRVWFAARLTVGVVAVSCLAFAWCGVDILLFRFLDLDNCALNLVAADLFWIGASLGCADAWNK